MIFSLRPLALACQLGASSLANAASPAIVSFTLGSSFTSFSSDETAGWTFTVTAGLPLSVSHLGWWDASPDTPLTASHQMGIWTSAGVLLGTATVDPSDALTGSFRYAALSSAITLAPGSHVIGGRDLVGDGDNYASSNGALVMNPRVVFNQAVRTDIGLSFAFPTVYNANSGGRIGPNFLATPVPEPGTLLLLAGGLGVVGLAGRRRSA